MDRKDIIRMAREAGFHVEDDDYGNPMLVTDSGDLTKFAQLVAAHERSLIEEKWHELEATMRVQLSQLESAHDETRSNFYYEVFGT